MCNTDKCFLFVWLVVVERRRRWPRIYQAYVYVKAYIVLGELIIRIRRIHHFLALLYLMSDYIWDIGMRQLAREHVIIISVVNTMLLSHISVMVAIIICIELCLLSSFSVVDS